MEEAGSLRGTKRHSSARSPPHKTSPSAKRMVKAAATTSQPTLPDLFSARHSRGGAFGGAEAGNVELGDDESSSESALSSEADGMPDEGDQMDLAGMSRENLEIGLRLAMRNVSELEDRLQILEKRLATKSALLAERALADPSTPTYLSVAHQGCPRPSVARPQPVPVTHVQTSTQRKGGVSPVPITPPAAQLNDGVKRHILLFDSVGSDGGFARNVLGLVFKHLGETKHPLFVNGCDMVDCTQLARGGWSVVFKGQNKLEVAAAVLGAAKSALQDTYKDMDVRYAGYPSAKAREEMALAERSMKVHISTGILKDARDEVVRNAHKDPQQNGAEVQDRLKEGTLREWNNAALKVVLGAVRGFSGARMLNDKGAVVVTFTTKEAAKDAIENGVMLPWMNMKLRGNAFHPRRDTVISVCARCGGGGHYWTECAVPTSKCMCNQCGGRGHCTVKGTQQCPHGKVHTKCKKGATEFCVRCEEPTHIWGDAPALCRVRRQMQAAVGAKKDGSYRDPVMAYYVGRKTESTSHMQAIDDAVKRSRAARLASRSGGVPVQRSAAKLAKLEEARGALEGLIGDGADSNGPLAVVVKAMAVILDVMADKAGDGHR